MRGEVCGAGSTAVRQPQPCHYCTGEASQCFWVRLWWLLQEQHQQLLTVHPGPWCRKDVPRGIVTVLGRRAVRGWMEVFLGLQGCSGARALTHCHQQLCTAHGVCAHPRGLGCAVNRGCGWDVAARSGQGCCSLERIEQRCRSTYIKYLNKSLIFLIANVHKLHGHIISLNTNNFLCTLLHSLKGAEGDSANTSTLHFFLFLNILTKRFFFFIRGYKT